MDTTPLPNQEDDPSDNGLTTDYIIRITTCNKFSSEQLLEAIKAEHQFYRYVIGRETTPQEHFHIVVSTDIEVEEQAVRDIVKAFLAPYWVTDTGKFPKGFGNKQYNLQTCNDLDTAVSYAVKMKEKWYEGFTDEYIAERQAHSFQKNKPSDFKSEYLALTTNFSQSDMTLHEFMVNFVTLKAKYGQQVQLHLAYGYALSNLIKRDPTEAENYVESFLYKQ